MIPDACDTIPRSARRLAQTGANATLSAMARPEDDIPDDDDAALFRAAIGPVTPLRAPPPAVHAPPPRPRTRVPERDAHEVVGEFRRLLDSHSQLEAGDQSSHRQPQVPHRILQRLRRGQYAIQDELDLHGASAQQAHRLLRDFIADAREHDHGCVRIIHGNGRQSDSPAPVLKNLVDQWLRLRSDVLAFHSAPPAQGGTGAVLVLLARR